MHDIISNIESNMSIEDSNNEIKFKNNTDKLNKYKK